MEAPVPIGCHSGLIVCHFCLVCNDPKFALSPFFDARTIKNFAVELESNCEELYWRL